MTSAYLISAGVTSTSNTLNSGDVEYVLSGGTSINTTLRGYSSETVSSGGVASGTQVSSGARLELSGGRTYGGIVNSNGQESVSSGGAQYGATIGASGLDIVLPGGTAVGTTVASGGWQFVFSGGSASATTLQNGGTLIIAAGGSATGVTSASGAVIRDGSAYDIVAGQTRGGLTLQPGDFAAVHSGGTATGTTVGFGGFLAVEAGGKVVGTMLENEMDVSAGGIAISTVVSRPPGSSDGGWELVSAGGTADGMVLAAGGNSELAVGAVVSGIVFAGSGAYLMIDGTSNATVPTTALSGFVAGDTIDLFNLTVGTVASATLLMGNRLQVIDFGTTLDLQLDPALNYIGAKFSLTQDYREGGIDITTNATACFRAGTRIRAEHGEVPVEALRAGDRVVLARGGSAPVRWLGHRLVDCRRHPTPADVWPVRIAAGAFGAGQPSRDLFLSPDHAVFVGGVLIPVRHLVNGATIAQVAADAVTYWHVELADHDVLLAEGLACESFLDTGNRAAFANGGGATTLHPDFSQDMWAAKGCAPLVLEGPALVKARSRLLARAARLGYRADTDPALAVWADGAPLPLTADGSIRRLHMPAGAREVRLVSRVWVPAHSQPEAADTRVLGIAISRVWLDGRAASLDSPALTTGWHPPEAAHRWTDGVASIDVGGARTLAFEVAMTGRYWRGVAGADAGLRRSRCVPGA